ncbi:hypothetical protein BJ742DRAFT_774101 [Cladochytrium replicatum]|nr:hypothetical protein BJ742DRAFT_774101 [Cladochytrium replicatum]
MSIGSDRDAEFQSEDLDVKDDGASIDPVGSSCPRSDLDDEILDHDDEVADLSGNDDMTNVGQRYAKLSLLESKQQSKKTTQQPKKSAKVKDSIMENEKKERKNGQGQRARQKLAEKKYGSQAKQLKDSSAMVKTSRGGSIRGRGAFIARIVASAIKSIRGQAEAA